MDKRICLMLAVLAAAVACVESKYEGGLTGSELEWYERESGAWLCNGKDMLKVPTGQEPKWSKNNDNVCRLTCHNTDAHKWYAPNNWALLADGGFMCCCAAKLDAEYADRKYIHSMPYVEELYQRKFGVISNSPLRDD